MEKINRPKSRKNIMETKFKITIEKIVPYMVKSNRYEASDGKRYQSTYSIPDKVSYKTVPIETGEVSVNREEVFMQVVEESEFELDEIVKTVNSLK